MHDSDTTIEPWWLKLTDIVGYEDDDSGDDDDSDSGDDEDEEESEDDSDDSDDSDSGEDDSDEDEDKDKPVTQKDIANLKSALRKERMARKKAEREAKRLKGRSKSDTKKEDDDKDEDKDESKGPSEREVKLAARLRDQAVDQVITRFATRMNFVDIDDVLRLVNRKDIDVMQDDDDPTEIEIDEEAVEDALKELAKKKKYLVATDGKNPRSGSKMSRKNKDKSGPSDEELRKKYKALR